MEMVVIREGFFEDLKNDLENLENLEKMGEGRRDICMKAFGQRRALKF